MPERAFLAKKIFEVEWGGVFANSLSFLATILAGDWTVKSGTSATLNCVHIA
jgi:hypothetical protein